MAARDAARAEENIRIGIMAAMTGPYAEYGLEAKRGVELALHEFEGRAGGKNVELIFEVGDETSTLIAARAQDLISQHGADIIVGPLSGGEGLALKEYAKTMPEIASAPSVSPNIMNPMIAVTAGVR